MGFDTRIVPDFLPELRWLRDAPFPQMVVIVERQIVLLVYLGHEIVNLRRCWGRWPPQLLRLRGHGLINVWHNASNTTDKRQLQYQSVGLVL